MLRTWPKIPHQLVNHVVHLATGAHPQRHEGRIFPDPDVSQHIHHFHTCFCRPLCCVAWAATLMILVTVAVSSHHVLC
jgi:hypothetical protein